jgi:enoyl-CoA hydratase
MPDDLAAYADFPELRFDRPADGVLRITLDGPGLNSVGPAAHAQIADVWRAVDRDPLTRVAMLCGAGKGFSAGGSFELIDSVIDDEEARLRTMREARDLVVNVIDCSKPIVSAIHGPRSGPGSWSRCSQTSRSRRGRRGSSTGTPGSASRPATTRRSAGRCCAVWRRRSTTC